MAEKLFYSMGEVAEMFDVNASLIRHWESQFSVIRPKRNKKGNRLFSPQDVENLKLIYHLVKERGMTLEGRQESTPEQQPAAEGGVERDAELMERLQRIRALLVEVREDLKAGEGEILADADAEVPVPCRMRRTPKQLHPAAEAKPVVKIVRGGCRGAGGRRTRDSPRAKRLRKPRRKKEEAGTQGAVRLLRTVALLGRNGRRTPWGRLRCKAESAVPRPQGGWPRRGRKNDNQTNQDTMLIREVTDVIERFAPLAWQESYDNAGLDRGAPGRRGAQGAAGRGRHGRGDGRGRARRVRSWSSRTIRSFSMRSSASIRQTRCSAASSGPSAAALRSMPATPTSTAPPEGMSWRLAEMLGVADLRVLQPAQADAKVGFGVVGELPGADGDRGVHAPYPAHARRAGRAPQRHRFARGAPRGGLHRCRGFDDRRRAPRRGRHIHHGGYEVQRLHDAR